MAGLGAGEAQRVAQHLDQVVLHQQCFVLVDGDADVALVGADHQVHARAVDADLRHEVVDALEHAQPRVGQVDRVDRVL